MPTPAGKNAETTATAADATLLGEAVRSNAIASASRRLLRRHSAEPLGRRLAFLVQEAGCCELRVDGRIDRFDVPAGFELRGSRRNVLHCEQRRAPSLVHQRQISLPRRARFVL